MKEFPEIGPHSKTNVTGNLVRAPLPVITITHDSQSKTENQE